MKAVLIILGVLVLLAIILGGWVWGARADLIALDQGVDGQWAQVQNVYQRRLDLIPNLVAAVDNFMQRQQQTLTEVIAMRQRVVELQGDLNNALQNQNPGMLDSISRQLNQQLGSFINVVVERYPEIKGEPLYADLMAQLEGTENRITQERRDYNDTVREYNVRRQSGAGPLIAGALFGFEYEKEFFEATPEAQTAPSVRGAFEQNPPTAQPQGTRQPQDTGAGQ